MFCLVAGRVLRTCVVFLLSVGMALLVASLCGCSAHRGLAVGSSARVDTVYRCSVRVDTLRTCDSVFLNTFVRGDTVFRVKEVTRCRDWLSVRVDTVYKAALRVDTIRVPVAVERRLTWWERNVEKPLAKTGLSLLLAMVIVALIPLGEWLWSKIRGRRE